MLPIPFQPTRVSAFLVYLLVIVVAFSLADHRLRNAAEAAPFLAPVATTLDTTQPYFSLSSNRTFGTTENPRLWLDYRGITSVDFRVYRVNDPARFFAQLSDPHQIGEEEEEQFAGTLTRKPSLLERVRALKSWAYSGIRNYFREQLKNDTRRSFNQKFRAPDTTVKRTPLNVADYARVPLLNPNQLVTSWREPLPALEHEYDRRMVPLGKREPGVYLVEAVGQELRAYTIVVVTDLAMVEKTSPNGELLAYAVDRRTGAPRADTQIEIVKERKPLAAGRTNAEGTFRTKIFREKSDEELGDPEISQADNSSYVILASQRDNFAISDLDSFYFNEPVANQNVGYIYTDRPIYRPTHQVYFKGILRVLDVYGALLFAGYLFVTTREATIPQLLLTLALVVVAPVLFFALQVVSINYVDGPGNTAGLITKSVLDGLRLIAISVPVFALTALAFYGLGRIQSQQTIVIAVRYLLAGVVAPLLAIQLWVAASHRGLRPLLRRTHHVAARAFAPQSVFIYACGVLVFGIAPYFLIFHTSQIERAWLELSLLAFRLVVSAFLILFGWVATVGTLALLTKREC